MNVPENQTKNTAATHKVSVTSSPSPASVGLESTVYPVAVSQFKGPPEFTDTPGIKQLYSLSKTHLYNLLEEGKIQACVPKAKGGRARAQALECRLNQGIPLRQHGRGAEMNILLSDIPNAPIAATPALEQARGEGDTTYRQIRTSIDEGAGALHQNLSQVAQPGIEMARAGGEVVKAGVDLSKLGANLGEGLSQTSALEKDAGQTTFLKNTVPKLQELQSSRDPSKPETWAAQARDFFANNQDEFTKGLSPVQKALIAPDLVRLEAKTMLQTGSDAYTQRLQNQKQDGINTMTDFVNAGSFQDAATKLDSMTQAGLLSSKEINDWKNTITGAHQTNSAKSFIQADPQQAQKIFQSCIDGQKQATVPDETGKPTLLDKLTVGELENFRNIAVQVGQKQYAEKMGAVSAIIETPSSRPQTIKQLEDMRQFQKLSPEDKTALRDQFLDVAKATDPDVIKRTLAAKQAILAWKPATDPTPFKTQSDIFHQLAYVPKAERADLITALKQKEKDWLDPSTGGGAGKIDPQKVAHDMAKAEAIEFYKQSYPDDSFQAKQRTDDALSSFDKAWADPKQRGNGTLDDARQIFNKIANPVNRSIGSEKILNSQPDTPQKLWDWISGKPPAEKPLLPADFGMKREPYILGGTPKGAANSSAPVGKITSYGYKNDDASDSLTRAGKSAIGNLTPQSLAVSPDVEGRMNASGIKIGDKVQLHLADGTSVVRTWDDRTAKEYKGKQLTGRFDLYSPSGKHEQDGSPVVGFFQGLTDTSQFAL